MVIYEPMSKPRSSMCETSSDPRQQNPSELAHKCLGKAFRKEISDNPAINNTFYSVVKTKKLPKRKKYATIASVLYFSWLWKTKTNRLSTSFRWIANPERMARISLANSPAGWTSVAKRIAPSRLRIQGIPSNGRTTLRVSSFRSCSSEASYIRLSPYFDDTTCSDSR